MKQLIFIETGMGVDVHGQNVTKAAVRAVKNAIRNNSMPGIKYALPDQSTDNLKVNVKLAIPRDQQSLDHEEVKKVIPYGSVSLEIVDGGMVTTSGVELKEENDHNDLMYIVNTSVEVGY